MQGAVAATKSSFAEFIEVKELFGAVAIAEPGIARPVRGAP